MSYVADPKSTRPAPRLLIALAIGLMLVFGGISTASAQEIKLGYVDLYRALESIDEGQQVRANLEAEFARRQEQLDEKQTEVMELRQRFEQQAMILSEENRQALAMELQQGMTELQELYMTLQTELAQQEAEATRRLFERMRAIIGEIGESEGYTMIVEGTEGSVLYAADGLDITDQVVRLYNERH